MKIFEDEIKTFIEFPNKEDGISDILLGIHLMEGKCEVCLQPVIGIQLGFLFFTITITVTKSHK